MLLFIIGATLATLTFIVWDVRASSKKLEERIEALERKNATSK